MTLIQKRGLRRTRSFISGYAASRSALSPPLTQLCNAIVPKQTGIQAGAIPELTRATGILHLRTSGPHSYGICHKEENSGNREEAIGAIKESPHNNVVGKDT